MKNIDPNFTKHLPKITLDYLNNSASIKNFFNRSNSIENYFDQIDEKKIIMITSIENHCVMY